MVEGGTDKGKVQRDSTNYEQGGRRRTNDVLLCRRQREMALVEGCGVGGVFVFEVLLDGGCHFLDDLLIDFVCCLLDLWLRFDSDSEHAI